MADEKTVITHANKLAKALWPAYGLRSIKNSQGYRLINAALIEAEERGYKNGMKERKK